MYKRQVWDFLPHALFVLGVAVAYSVKIYLADVMKAVSYTHLDVYKRQDMRSKAPILQQTL